MPKFICEGCGNPDLVRQKLSDEDEDEDEEDEDLDEYLDEDMEDRVIYLCPYCGRKYTLRELMGKNAPAPEKPMGVKKKIKKFISYLSKL